VTVSSCGCFVVSIVTVTKQDSFMFFICDVTHMLSDS